MGWAQYFWLNLFFSPLVFSILETFLHLPLSLNVAMEKEEGQLSPHFFLRALADDFIFLSKSYLLSEFLKILFQEYVVVFLGSIVQV